MPRTQSQPSQTHPAVQVRWPQQTNPPIEIKWDQGRIGGFDPAPNVTSTATVAPEAVALATASQLSSREGTTSATISPDTACAWAPAPEDPLAPAWTKLEQIKNEGVGEAILALAQHVLGRLAEDSLFPARVVLTADREIAFVFFGDEFVAGGAHRRVATMTCSDEGVSAMLEDRQGDGVQAWDVEAEQMTETLDRVRNFLAGK